MAYDSRVRRSLIAFVVALGAPATAAAFDTPEHAVYTRLALLEAAADPALAKVLNADMVALARVSGSPSRLCQALVPPPKDQCIALPELTALMGDYASSTDNLLFRFLDVHQRPPHVSDSFWAKKLNWLTGAAKAMYAKFVRGPRLDSPIYQGTWPVGTADAVAILRRDQQERIAAYRPSESAKACLAGAMSVAPGFMDAIRAIPDTDRSYLALAALNPSHFRFDAGAGELARFASLYDARSGEAEADAIAFYADLHAGALAASAASQSAGRPDADRQSLGATALLMELAALHYLQDSVSAGHISWNAKNTTKLRRDAAARAVLHNSQCNEAVRVNAAGLCGSQAAAKHPSLARVCSSKDRVASIHGDDVSVCGAEPVPSGGNAYGVTAEWAIAVSEISLREFLASRTSGDGSLFAVPAVPSKKLFEDCGFTPSTIARFGDAAGIYGYVCGWRRAASKVRNATSWSGQPVTRQDFEALKALPMPDADVAQPARPRSDDAASPPASAAPVR